MRAGLVLQLAGQGQYEQCERILAADSCETFDGVGRAGERLALAVRRHADEHGGQQTVAIAVVREPLELAFAVVGALGLQRLFQRRRSGGAGFLHRLRSGLRRHRAAQAQRAEDQRKRAAECRMRQKAAAKTGGVHGGSLAVVGFAMHP